MRKPSKKVIAIAATAVLVLGGAGAAYAYWTATGSGTGTATTGTSEAVTVTQTSVITDLSPGGAVQTLSGTFTNPNDAPVNITSVSVEIASITGNPGVCTSADYTLGGTITFTNPISTGSTWTGATIAFANDAARNQDGCQGATVNLSYTVQ